MEEFNRQEKIREEDVIAALDSEGIENPECKALYVKFVDQCNSEAETRSLAHGKESHYAHRAKIEAQKKIGRMLAKTKKYKGEALESLHDALWAASHKESTRDLVDEIRRLMGSL